MDKDYACGDYGTITDWTQFRVTVPIKKLELTEAIMSMVCNQLQTEDYSDIDLKTCYGDLIDESILHADTSIASVSAYLPKSVEEHETIAFIRSKLENADITFKMEVNGVNEADWANEWKNYYKPIKVGEKIVIVPAWETYCACSGEIIVKMDPGMAFGTGTHETTRLVIRLLEQYTKKGCRMLDVGTGSGILAICASRLGADVCNAYDIDPMSVRVANENIKDSGLTNITCQQSDLLKQVDLSHGQYDLICANIVADIIIRMTPDVGQYLKQDGVLLLSGIIDQRCQDVIDTLMSHGFKVIDKKTENDWCALAVQKA